TNAELNAWSLANVLADVFAKYQAWRRDWLLAWDRGEARDDWQGELWRRAARPAGARVRVRLPQCVARCAARDDGDGSWRDAAFLSADADAQVLGRLADAARASRRTRRRSSRRDRQSAPRGVGTRRTRLHRDAVL